jgi:solute carrier family 25 protein 14/30
MLSASQTLANEGPLAFYKGFLPFWLRLGPHTIISLIAFEHLSVFSRRFY